MRFQHLRKGIESMEEYPSGEGTTLEIANEEGAVRSRKSLCRKGLRISEKAPKTQKANRMLTVFQKSE